MVWSSPTRRRPPAVNRSGLGMPQDPPGGARQLGKGMEYPRQIMVGWMDGWNLPPAYYQPLYCQIELFRLLRVLAFQYEVVVFLGFFLQTLSEKKLQAVVNPIDQSVVSALFWF